MASKRFVKDLNDNAGVDRISNLPSLVTQRILECLPLEDVLVMSFLSRHWRYQWTQLPQLILNWQFFDVLMGLRLFKTSEDVQDLSNIVDNVLLRHVGPISKFVLVLPSWIPMTADISKWIQMISAKGVKELILNDHRCDSTIDLELIEYDDVCGHEKNLPSCLFSSVGLTHLTLHDCCIYSLPQIFSGFPCITSLELITCCVATNTLPILISSCPLLEILKIYIFGLDTNASIHAPKLRDLEFRGSTRSLHFIGTKELDTLFLEAEWHSMRGLEKFFCCLSCVQTLVLSGSFWEVCYGEDVIKIPGNLARLTTLKLLNIPIRCRWSISLTLSLLKSSQHLQQLEIEGYPTFCKCKRRSHKVLETTEDCNLQHLKNVALVCIEGWRHDLQLIRLLLACSPVLEVITIELDPVLGGAVKEKKMAKKLQGYHRASTNVEIIFKG